jgi:hypothetical protein
MKAIVEAYKDTTNPKKIWGTGLHVAKQKYVTLKADDRSLYGKLVRFHPRNSLWASYFGSPNIPNWPPAPKLLASKHTLTTR